MENFYYTSEKTRIPLTVRDLYDLPRDWFVRHEPIKRMVKSSHEHPLHYPLYEPPWRVLVHEVGSEARQYVQVYRRP